MLKVSGLQKSVHGQELFRELSFMANPGDRVAIIGQNGCGKSTLLRILAGAETADAGTVERVQEQVLYVPQHLDADATQTLNDYLDLAEYGDGWRLLSDLDMIDVPLDAPIAPLSGGQKTKLQLIKAFSCPSTMLLLDEPTNHLDVATQEWLIAEIKRFRGIIVLVSHDRAFLNHVATHVVELDAATRQAMVFHGNYDVYKEEKAAWRERQQEAYELQQKRKREMEEWLVLKRQEATVHPNPATGRLIRHMEHRLEREIERQQVLRPMVGKRMKSANFAGMVHQGKWIVRLVGVEKTLGSTRVLDGVSLELRGAARVRLSGENGSGKSTIMRLLAGEMAPDAGTVAVGENVQVGYFAQQLEHLDSKQTVYEAFRTGVTGSLSEGRIRAILGAYLFTGEAIEKRVGQLSYGERVRLRFAMMLQHEYQLLLLDEPTNHLDIPSREAIEAGLRAYEGAMLIISHDDYFAQAIGVTQEYVLQQGALVRR